MQVHGLIPLPLSVFLAGDRIVLKAHEEEIAPKMFHAIDLDRVRLGQYLPWVSFTKTANDTLNYIEVSKDAWLRFERFDYGIFRKSDGDWIGNIGVHNLAWNHRRCELGYWLIGSAEGHGYVSEAVQALEEHLFGLGFHRIEIRCSNLNTRSANVPKKCNYTFEAELVEDSIENGVFRNTLVFAKLHTPGK